METKVPFTLSVSSEVYLLLLFLMAVLWTGPAGDFPIGDDWQYGYPVKTWVETGFMEFKGIFAPNILLQILWGFLFCKLGGDFSYTFLRLSTLFTSFFCVFIFFKLLKQIGTPEKTAFYVSLTLMLTPLFYYLSFTFFTDIPFLLLFCLSIYYFFKYLQSGRTQSLVWAVIFAVAGFYIRQPGLLLIPAFGIFILIKNKFSRSSQITTTILFISTLGVYFSLEKYIKPALGIADNFVPVGNQFYIALIETPLNTGLEWIKKGIKTFIYLGLFAMPLLPFFWSKRNEFKFFNSRNIALLILLNIALFFLLFFIGKTFPFGGNILFNFGLGSELLADVYTFNLPNTPRAPAWSMLLIQFVSQISATFLFIVILKKYQQLTPLQKEVALFLFLFNLIYLPVMSITSFFDRYLLPTIVSFLIIISFFVQPGQWNQKKWKYLPFLLISGFSLLATKDFMAWNTAKNQAFHYLINKGISIREMDAGYEYNGFYNYHFPKEERADRSFWWVTDDKYLITFGPVDGYQEMATFPYYRFLFLRPSAIRVLQRNE